MGRATDSDIDAVIASVEPLLVRHQFNKAVAALTRHYEGQLQMGGPTAARRVINAVWHLSGERRVKPDASFGALDDRRNK